MYCPKCGALNVDNASFCRGCGTNLSLVPQAMTGRMPEQPASYDAASVEHAKLRLREYAKQRRRERPPSMERAIKSFFMGLGFIFVAIAAKSYAPAGEIWWFWMLIPAFSMIGGGIAEYARFKRSQPTPQLAAPGYTPPAVAPPRHGPELPPRPAADIYTPTSVTDHTTQLLDRER